MSVTLTPVAIQQKDTDNPFGRKITTTGGLEVLLVSPEEWKRQKPVLEKRINWMPYDSHLIEMHIRNCGFGIIDPDYMTAIDNEYDLEDVYNFIEAGRSKK